MPQSLGQRTYNKFVRGLITEASELNFPTDASVDEDNCVLLRDGSRRRRLGVDRETSNNSSHQIGEAGFQDGAITFFKWDDVAGSADRIFGVLQIGDRLYFQDLASDPITIFDFQVDLASHTIEGGDPAKHRCDMVGGRGALFVVSKGINPIIVQYDKPSNSISVIETVLTVRDFEGVDDDLDFDAEPTDLTKKHEYNLRNQGWNQPAPTRPEPITIFHDGTGRYPGNNKQWHAGKGDPLSAAAGDLVVEFLEQLNTGKTQAPRGHFLLSPLERTLRERERISKILGLNDVDAGNIIIGVAPTAQETPNGTTKVLTYCDEVDAGAGDIHDEDAEHHQLNFLGTEAGLGPSCSIDTTIKRLGAGSVRKLRGAPGGESGLNFLRNSGNEWTELLNDQDAQLSMFIRLNNYVTTEASGIMSMFTRWSESSGFRSWAMEWWPQGVGHTLTARDQGDANNAGFVFESSPIGGAGSEYRILPSRFPYQIPLLKWVWVCFSWNQSDRQWQIFVQEEGDPIQQIGETQTVDAASFPFKENADNLFVAKRNSVGSQGSWDGWIDEVHIQEQRVVQAKVVDPVPPVAPSAVEFFAGRVCYGGGGESGLSGRVLMSPVLERLTQAGECHAMGDPTAEINSELIDSDGTDIAIDNMGEVKKLFAMGNHLIVLASNGVWTISGTNDTGFKASGFEIAKLSSAGVLSPGAVVDSEGTPYWWGSSGIFRIIPSESLTDTKPFKLEDLSIETMQGFYDGNDDFAAIPNWSKEYASGVWDAEAKRIIWLYQSVDPNDDTYRNHYNRALILDPRLGSFYPWTFSELASNTPYVAGAFSTSGVGQTTQEVDVAGGQDLLLDNSAVQIVVDREIISGRDILLKFVVIEPSSGSSLFTFGELNDATFVDWDTVGAPGVAFTSFAQAGHELGDNPGHMKWAPRILTYVRRGTNHDLTMQARWEWADASASGKFTTAQSVYTSRNLDTDGTAGFPVVVSSKKIRGRGHAVSVRYISVLGKDFELVGWTTEFAVNQRVS